MVDANGLRFRVSADGPPTGELFILLHGFPEGAESWTRQLAALARAGALAVAPDMRGYGGSDAPAGVQSYALADLVEDVVGIIKGFGREAAHVAGHDWGALVAWFFAGIHPEMTRTLTVLSVGHPATLGAATADDEDQKARSRYIRLFLQEGKAESVLAIDQDAAAVKCTRENAARNGLRNLEVRAANAVEALRGFDKEGRKFDTIVLDPPAFAKRKEGLEGALRAYREINYRAVRLLAPGGVLISCSCSGRVTPELFGEVIGWAAQEAKRPLAGISI